VHRTQAILGTRVPGARDGGRRATFARGQVAHAPDQFVSGLARHVDVRNDEIGVPGDEGASRLAGAADRAHVPAAHRERIGEQIARVRIVVDDQQLEIHGARRRRHCGLCEMIKRTR